MSKVTGEFKHPGRGRLAGRHRMALPCVRLWLLSCKGERIRPAGPARQAEKLHFRPPKRARGGHCSRGPSLSHQPVNQFLALQEKTMREDTEIRIPRDDERIDVTDLKEVDYWTQWFGVSEERLRTAVASAGTVKDDLRVYLGLP
jgi:hypothetical protein